MLRMLRIFDVAVSARSVSAMSVKRMDMSTRGFRTRLGFATQLFRGDGTAFLLRAHAEKTISRRARRGCALRAPRPLREADSSSPPPLETRQVKRVTNMSIYERLRNR